MTGRATLVEVEPMREATLGANMRAAIVYEDVEMIGRARVWRRWRGVVKLCWN